MDTDEYREQLNRIEEQLSAIYRQRRALTEAYAADHPAVLPAPRQRTAVQERVARCPRCSARLSETGGLEK
jgi:hypothetical protein